jgi:diguanylate cyclase (GGDEF)-like protein
VTSERHLNDGAWTHRRRPLHSVSAGVLVVLFIVVEVLVFRSYQRTSSTSDSVTIATSTTTTLANVHREILGMRIDVLEHASRADIELKIALIDRQINVVLAVALSTANTGLEDQVGPIQEGLARFGRRIGSLPVASATVDRATGLALGRQLDAIGLASKALFDDQERLLFGVLNDEVTSSARAQRLLVGLGGSVILLGVGLAFLLRRAVRSDFARAHDALLDEMHEREILEDKLTFQAYHDHLTGLANSPLFIEVAAKALARSARRDTSVAILYVDIDDFKAVNDRLGHAAGDELLGQMAGRLIASVRDGDTVARLGGDEFAILLEDAGSLKDVTEVATRIIDAVSRPYAVLGRHEARVGASVGIAVDEGNLDVDALVRAADVAMYQAKAAGKHSYVIFDPILRDQMLERDDLEGDLVEAISDGQFVCHYQPIVDMATGSIEAFEALVRWEHPVRGTLPPVVFISLAEETGAIVPLGAWVLEEACRTAASWQAHANGPVSISVNISAHQLRMDGFGDDVRDVLERTGLDPRLLILEITEGSMLHDADATVGVLRDMRSMGVRIAIDDFGTGYSALSYLQFLPVDILKIDRAFVSDMDSDYPHASAIARSICQLAESFGMETVAEGVERRGHVERLESLGCRLGQGFLFARPVPAAAAQEMLLVRFAGSLAPSSA